MRLLTVPDTLQRAAAAGGIQAVVSGMQHHTESASVQAPPPAHCPPRPPRK